MSEYPKFIKIAPSGEDAFEGKPQERISACIAEIIKNDKSNRHIIGLEGSWGSGKSNVVEILKKNLDENYHFFIYDVWGNQEDLNRRTFLEELIDDQIDSGILPSGKWNEKLKKLLSRKVSTERKESPQLSSSFIIFIVLTFLHFPANMIAEFVYNSNKSLALLLLISFCPYLLGFVGYVIWKLFSKLRGRNKQSSTFSQLKKEFSQLFYIFNGKEVETSLDETISEKEPTAREFRQYLSEIEIELKSGKKGPKTLIIVFDNFDRLPPEKLQKMWSTIHTYFSEQLYKNIWVIIPFEREFVRDAFKEINDKNVIANDGEHDANSFINKTFEIIYKVSPPVLSDWKRFFDIKLKEAFGEDISGEEYYLKNIFDLCNKDKNITPREILAYINEIVANQLLWKSEIPLKYFGLYYFKKASMKNPLEILDDKFLDSAATLFSEDTGWQKYISAIHFSVPVEIANSILLSREIETNLKQGIDLKTVFKHPNFIDVYESIVLRNEFQSDISPYVMSKSLLSLYEYEDKWTDKTRKILVSTWDMLVTKAESSTFRPDELDSYKSLLKYCSEEKKKKLITDISTKSVEYEGTEKEGNYPFRGSKYFDLINQINTTLFECKAKIDIFSLLKDAIFPPKSFLDFVNSAKEDYVKYKVDCDNTQLNKFLFENSNINYEHEIRIIKDDYEFEEYRSKLKESIDKGSINDNIIYSILSSYRILSDDLPLETKLPVGDSMNLLEKLPLKHDAIPDLIGTLIFWFFKYHYQLPWGNLVNAQNKFNKIINTTDNQNIEKIAPIIEYYLIYSDLLKMSTSDNANIALIKELTVKITNQSLNASKLDVRWVLENFESIQNEFENVDGFVSQFIKRFFDWEKYIIQYLGENDYIKKVSLSFIEYIIQTESSVSSEVIHQSLKWLNNATEEEWRQAFENEDTLFLLTLSLSDEKKLGKLKSEIVYEAYKKFIKNLALSEKKIDYDFDKWNEFLDCLDGRKLSAVFVDIRDILLHHDHSEVTGDEILFFENGLRKYGKLENKPDDVTRKILTPCTQNKNLLKNVFIPYFDEFKQIITDAGDMAEDLKQNIKKMILSNPEIEGLKEIANELGIQLEDNDTATE